MDAGVRSYPSGNLIASRANTPPTTACPASLAPLRRPRLRCMYSLMKSSAKPTRPRPVIRNSTSSPDADMALPVTTWPIRYPVSDATMITVPPMVGVPRLDRCPAGPSDLISWP